VLHLTLKALHAEARDVRCLHGEPPCRGFGWRIPPSPISSTSGPQLCRDLLRLRASGRTASR
jgi:hypothetical protein